MTGIKVGIEDMSIHITKHYVERDDLARKRAKEREISPDDLIEKIRNLRIERFSVFYQTDIVEAGTEAILELMQRNNLEPKDISRIYTPTESSLDQAKALGTYIVGKLKKHGYNFSHVETRESKLACLPGSYDVYDCCNYVELHPDRKVIVLCVDEAIYDQRSGAEPTQGAGAIALLISANPSLVILDFSNVGVFTMDSMGYYRPPGKETPIVTSWVSIYDYLYCMREAFDDYKRKTGEQEILGKLDWLIFHNPYGLMVEDFLSYLLIHEHRDTKNWKDILKQIGMKEPTKSGVEAYRDKITREKHRKFREKFRKTKLFQRFFRKKVEPSVIASRQTGNLYSGSLFLQLASLITYGKPKKGDLISFWGFGSGSSSLFYQGRINNPSDFKLKEKLKNREKLEIEEYERWRQERTSNLFKG